MNEEKSKINDFKDIFKLLILFIVLVIAFLFKDSIADFVTDEVLYKGSNKVLTYNEYYIESDYNYVQNTDSNYVTSYQEILNMLYTIINSGDESFTFYCDYPTCIEDVTEITNSNRIISHINNFVHPYNSFESINIDINPSGKITLKTNKVYSSSQIEFINNYIKNFVITSTNVSMTNYDKIKVFHDHIVNNTRYDESITHNSYNAYNLITSGLSICGGYSDILAIYLNYLGIKNYKITSHSHVWNLVELDGVWYHLDATWNDPIASDGNQYLLHNFFLISTYRLHELDTIEHNFDRGVYSEAQ